MITLATIDGRYSTARSMSADTPLSSSWTMTTSVRESLELSIENSGWRPETFTSAREFLAHPRALVPSCLVLDVALPDLTGLQLQKRVAAGRPTCPSFSSRRAPTWRPASRR